MSAVPVKMWITCATISDMKRKKRTPGRGPTYEGPTTVTITDLPTDVPLFRFSWDLRKPGAFEEMNSTLETINNLMNGSLSRKEIFDAILKLPGDKEVLIDPETLH